MSDVISGDRSLALASGRATSISPTASGALPVGVERSGLPGVVHVFTVLSLPPPSVMMLLYPQSCI